MNFKTTLLLVLLVAGVACYFVFFEMGTLNMRGADGDDADNTQRPTLFAANTLTPGNVTRIRIERGDESVVLSATENGWRQIEPVHFPLRDAAISQLINDAAGLQFSDRFTPGSEDRPTLEDTDLAPPRVAITFDQNDTAHTIHLGALSTGNGYARVDDDERIYIVDNSLHTQLLDKTVHNWRRRTLDVPSPNSLQRIVIDRPDQHIELVRDLNRWFIGPDKTQRASAQAVAAIIDAIRIPDDAGQTVQSARIQRFEADRPDRLDLYGLADPDLTLTLHEPIAGALSANAVNGATAQTTTDAPPAMNRYTLRIGSRTSDGAWFATWSTGDEPSPVVFALGINLAPLRQGVDALRDPHLTTTDAAEVWALKADRADQPTLHLRRDVVNDGFAFGEPAPDGDYSVDAGTARDAVEQLARAEAVGYVADFTATGEPAMRIAIESRGDGSTETLTLYPADEPGQLLSVRNDEPVAYRVEREVIADLFKPRLAFRSRVVDVIGDRTPVELTLQRDDGVTFTFARPAAASAQTQPAWTLQNHETTEPGALDALLNDLAPLRVERWLSESVMPAPDWRALRITFADGATRVLRHDSQTGRATMDGIETAFVLSQPMIDRLNAEYRDRQVLDLAQNEIDTVTLQSGDQQLIVQKEAGGQFVTRSGRAINQGKAARLYDTFTALHVERYLPVDADKLPAANYRVTIETNDGATHEINLHGTNSERWQRVITLNGRAMRLSEKDYRALIADAPASEEKTDEAQQTQQNGSTPDNPVK